MKLFNEYLKNPNKWILISKNVLGRDCYALKNRFESLCSRYYLDKNGKDLLNQIKEILDSTSQSKKICLNECISDKISACNSKNDIGILYIYCRCYLLNFFFF